MRLTPEQTAAIESAATGTFDDKNNLIWFLEEHGLHLVTEAERKVLEAMARADIETYDGSYIIADSHDVCMAEIAKRGENPFAGVRASDWLKELREDDGEKL